MQYCEYATGTREPLMASPGRTEKQNICRWDNRQQRETTGKTRYQFTFNTLRPRPNGRHFADDIFKSIFLNENVWIPIKIPLKFVPKGPVNNIPALVQIMAWRRPGDKPLSEPMMVCLTTHICVTRPQWVNSSPLGQNGRHFADGIFRCIFLNENA